MTRWQLTHMRRTLFGRLRAPYGNATEMVRALRRAHQVLDGKLTLEQAFPKKE